MAIGHYTIPFLPCLSNLLGKVYSNQVIRLATVDGFDVTSRSHLFTAKANSNVGGIKPPNLAGLRNFAAF